MKPLLLVFGMILVLLGITVYAAHRDGEEKIQLEKIKSEERIRIIEAFSKQIK